MSSNIFLRTSKLLEHDHRRLYIRVDRASGCAGSAQSITVQGIATATGIDVTAQKYCVHATIEGLLEEQNSASREVPLPISSA